MADQGIDGDISRDLEHEDAVDHWVAEIDKWLRKVDRDMGELGAADPADPADAAGSSSDSVPGQAN